MRTRETNEIEEVGVDPAVAWQLPRAVRIVRRTQETHDAFTIELESLPDLEAVCRPGQFNMLFVPPMGEVPISVSGAGPFIHTIRAVGPVTRAMAELKPGAFIGLRGPFGTGWPLEELAGRDILILAGGVGMAPLRPVVYHLLANRYSLGRVALLYGARTPEDRLFAEEMDDWERRSDILVRNTVDMATAGWMGHVGVITTLIASTRFDPPNTVALVCGPEAMMHFSVRELHRRGVGSDQVFVSMERNMKCAVGLCGHCQYGPSFVCKDGPVYRFDRIEPFFSVREF